MANIAAPEFITLGGIVSQDIAFGIDDVSSVLVDASGRALLGGGAQYGPSLSQADFVLARYDASGQLDASYGDFGIVLTDFGEQESASDMLLQPGNKILLGGSSYTT